VYLTLQLYHLGERKKAAENELISLRTQNDRAKAQIAAFTSRPALQRRARGESRDLRFGSIILSAETDKLVLGCLFAFSEMIKLQRQINVAQSGQRQKCSHNDPARKRGRIYRITVSST